LTTARDLGHADAVSRDDDTEPTESDVKVETDAARLVRPQQREPTTRQDATVGSFQGGQLIGVLCVQELNRRATVLVIDPGALDWKLT